MKGCPGVIAAVLDCAKSDLVIVERRRDIRIIVSMPGSCVLLDRRNSLGDRQTYPCRAVNLSPHALALTSTSVTGRLGERVVATIDQLGTFDGSVIRLLKGGFVMTIDASEEDRDRLAAKIEWVEQHKNFDVTDKRSDTRFVPANPHSLIVFADGRAERCVILDLSVSGAALATATVPPLGAPLALSTIVGRVVRQFKGGFAMRFLGRENMEHIEAKVSLESALASLNATR